MPGNGCLIIPDLTFAILYLIMQRFVALLLMCLYLPAALNATITAHYCMGTLTGVDISPSTPAGNTCSKCSMIKKDQKGCCHDKQEILKLNQDQVSSSALIITAPFAAILQSHYFSVTQTFFVRRAGISPLAHNPPLVLVSPLLLHCVFRI